MKLIQKVSAAFGNIRLRERMLLLYLVGGILPLLLANIYMYASVRSLMIQQTKDNSVEELSVIGRSLEESISVIEEVSKRLYFDEDIEHIAGAHDEDRHFSAGAGYHIDPDDAVQNYQHPVLFLAGKGEGLPGAAALVQQT